MADKQTLRLIVRTAFFALFVLAPPLDLFRLDLNVKHFILFGHPWTLGIDPFLQGETGVGDAALNLFVRAFIPIGGTIALGVWVSWKYGRLYCGWLCPHFSVVEAINGLMRRASGKPTLWESKPLPERLPDGRTLRPRTTYWLPATLGVVGFSFLWAITLLTYLLPPGEIYHNLFHGELTRNQAVFLSVGTVVFVIEFTLARHLFCRFGCAVGLFQSLAWMANSRAMVVGFDGSRAAECVDCNAACDNACPMRLKPRSIKRRMFTCTQCARCITACEEVQAENPDGTLLEWLQDECALNVSERDFGHRPSITRDCFRRGGADRSQARSVIPDEAREPS
jgi:ferredoxin-type protein NapH